ncbi:bifunctional diguanylate cyclase/phosphodiesterase [Herminiimonas sp. CN]|uniref:putative bifunctional diguanylate cyclase/phosphodiesterase n=1 Tax=Herminiimonas sp. CN TaxID=1349818 RepID=UPI000AE90903|nr:EAL domain-containing protein [Herminiimonas sp. CN]
MQSSPLGNAVALKSQLDILTEAAGDAVFRLDANGIILSASTRALILISAINVISGHFLTEFVPEPDRAALAATIAQTLQSRQPAQIKVHIHTDAGVFWFELQLLAYLNPQLEPEMLVIGHDISLQKASEERLRHISTHDALTGLPNRSLASDRLQAAIMEAHRDASGFTLMVLDLDGFKKVNDALGYTAGDALLCIAAQRLHAVLHPGDMLARTDGNQFAVMLPNLVAPAEIYSLARSMISALQRPFEIQDRLLYVSASVGAACYPQHGETEAQLLAHAETALYCAKETGKARCIIYDQEKFNRPPHDVTLEAAMFEAVKNGEFLLHYQPIVDANTRQIVGFEALMRWQHPELGLVPPVRFIPMAENNGLINLLGAWALKTACIQIRQFEKAARRPLYVAVNVSPRQFRNDLFLQRLDDALDLSGLDGSQLLLEITEGILMSDPELAENLLTSIRARGVRIAIDDFGTGYSSLAYLKRFPISVLKIDRAFIKDVLTSPKDAAICSAIISLASHLNLSTVAEGVETRQQLDFIAAQGCGLIQGFYTGRPLDPATAIDLLQAQA